MNLRLLLILFLKIELPLNVKTTFTNFFKDCREAFVFNFYDTSFKYSPIDGRQHYMLDTFYVQYFEENSKEMRQRMSGRIAIFTHIHFLHVIIEQKKEILQKIDSFLVLEKYFRGKFKPGMISIYEKLSTDITRILWMATRSFSRYTLSPVSVRQMCYLLIIRQDLINALNFASRMPFSDDQRPSCYELENAHQSVQERDDQVSDWILSDLIMFFPKRPKFLQFFQQLFERNDFDEIYGVRKRFLNLIGFSRMFMLFSTHYDQLGTFVELQSAANFYTILYKENFDAKNEKSKWPVKIVLEKFLYDELGRKIIENEQTKLVGQQMETNDVDLQMRLKFSEDLSFWWSICAKNFWLHEKTIVKLIEKLAKEKWRKATKVKELLTEHRKKMAEIGTEYLNEEEKHFAHLIENGPNDATLFRALAFCVPKAFAEFGKQRQRQKDMEGDKSQLVQLKMLVCVGKQMKSANRKDEIMAKLHLDKMEDILGNESDQEKPFKDILIKNRQMLGTLLGPNGRKRINQLLFDEIKYFSTEEQFSSSSSDDGQSFKDANDDEINNKNNNNNNSINDELENNEKIKNENNCEIKNYFMEEKIKLEKKREKEERKKNYNEKKWKKGKKERKNNCEKREKGEKSEEIKEEIEKREKKKIIEEKKEKSEEIKEEKRREKGKTKKYEKERKIEKEEKYWEEDECVVNKAIKELKMEKYSDLLNEKYLAKFYEEFLSSKLEENCVIFLDVAMFARAIHSKLKFIKIRTKNLKSFEEKWQRFTANEILSEKSGKLELELNKLYFVDIALNKMAFGPIEQKQMEKAMEIFDEKENGKFNKFKMDKILNQLHLQTFGLLCAKKLTNLINEIEKYLGEKAAEIGKRIKMILPDEKSGNEFLKKYISEMEALLKQQKLVRNYSLSYAYEGRQYQLIRTDPESLENDLKMEKEMIEFMQPYSLDQSRRTKLTELIGQIKQIIRQWIQSIPTASEKVAKAKLLRNGSFLMNSELDGSDLDLICVVPEQIKFQHFFNYNGDNLYSLLKRKLTDASVSWRPGKVPLIRMECGQIEVDLLMVPVPDRYLSDESNLEQLKSDQLISEMQTENGIYSLAGYQSGKFQLALVQSQNTLSFLLKIVKIWAKNRLIYSGLFGFFNGVTLSIMATQICVLFPNAPLPFLLFQFFSIYAKWHWPSVPIMLKQLTPTTLNTIVRFRPPIFGQSVQSLMTVITPTFPEQNTAYNVNAFTLRTIVEEFKIADEILAENPQNWERIFEEINYEEKFAHFALIICYAFDFDSYASNCAYQKSRIRQNLLEWANAKSVSEQLDNYHLIPKFEQKSNCNVLKEKNFCTFWLVGLSMRREFGESENEKELMPIYQTNSIYSPHQPHHFAMSSFFTKAQNLHRIIDQLKLFC